MGRTAGCNQLLIILMKIKQTAMLIISNGLLEKKTILKHAYQRRPKNTPEQEAAYKERHRVSPPIICTNKRAEEKRSKIEESLTENNG